jgi:hypothetical protein
MLVYGIFRKIAVGSIVCCAAATKEPQPRFNFVYGLFGKDASQVFRSIFT